MERRLFENIANLLLLVHQVVEPKRAISTSTAARKIEEEKQIVESSSSDGLQIKQNAAMSWERAADECRAKVAAIVKECQRLNQKYRDAIFDLETNPYCLQGLSGRYPKASTLPRRRGKIIATGLTALQ